VALEVALLVRVLVSFRRLYWFAAAVGMVAAQDLILMQLRYNTNRYFVFWVVTAAIVMMLQAAAAVEAFSNVLSEYKGIGWAVTALLSGALVIAAAATALLSGPDIRAIRELSRLVSITFAAKRALCSILALFMLLGSVLFRNYRVPRRPNDGRHLALMTCLMGFYAVIYLSQNLYRKDIALENLILQGGVCLCLTGWLIALRASGEIRQRSEIEPINSELFRQQNEQALRVLRAAKRS